MRVKRGVCGADPADMAENALRQSLIMSQGLFAIFFASPVAAGITALALFFFALPVLSPWWRRLRGVPGPVAPRPTHQA